MSQPVVQPTASIGATPRDRPTPPQLLSIASAVILTVLGVVAVFRLFGPDVRPASTPTGWSGVYGDRFALALPNDFGTSTSAADLERIGVPGVRMVGGKDGSDPNTPDAVVVVVSSQGTADTLAASIVPRKATTTQTTITSGDAITSDLSTEGASGRVWVIERRGEAWAVVVFARDGGPYELDDLGTKIANSFDAA
jgi:hypothetical protein